MKTIHHVYLSPHSDDAILSCGAAMARQRERGCRVTVITITAGQPDQSDFSPFCYGQHERWLQEHPGTDPNELRRLEDLEACRRLDVALVQLQFLDCIYRHNHGIWFYTSDDDLFDSVHPEDELFSLQHELERLFVHLEPDKLYAPLAAGKHVDHQIVRAIGESWARKGQQVAFYEDFPYVENGEMLWQALNLPPAASWKRQSIYVNHHHVEAKISALWAYQSQLDGLFEDDMPERTRSYAQSVGSPGMAEIVWQLDSGVQAEE